jgi:hypothetical protein
MALRKLTDAEKASFLQFATDYFAAVDKLENNIRASMPVVSWAIDLAEKRLRAFIDKLDD